MLIDFQDLRYRSFTLTNFVAKVRTDPDMGNVHHSTWCGEAFEVSLFLGDLFCFIGSDVNFLFFFGCLSEISDSFSNAFTDLRKFSGSKDNQDDDQDDETKCCAGSRNRSVTSWRAPTCSSPCCTASWIPSPAGYHLRSAGHALAYLVHGPSGEWQRLDATRPPLGLGSGAADATVPWRRGEDILVLLTDGIVDATSGPGARFGEQRVLGHVARLHARPTREILEAIFTDLAAFTGGGPASDDRTAVLLRV